MKVFQRRDMSRRYLIGYTILYLEIAIVAALFIYGLFAFFTD